MFVYALINVSCARSSLNSLSPQVRFRKNRRMGDWYFSTNWSKAWCPWTPRPARLTIYHWVGSFILVVLFFVYSFVFLFGFGRDDFETIGSNVIRVLFSSLLPVCIRVAFVSWVCCLLPIIHCPIPMNVTSKPIAPIPNSPVIAQRKMKDRYP